MSAMIFVREGEGFNREVAVLDPKKGYQVYTANIKNRDNFGLLRPEPKFIKLDTAVVSNSLDGWKFALKCKTDYPNFRNGFISPTLFTRAIDAVK